MKKIKHFLEFITENIYIGLYKNNDIMGVLSFNSIDDVKVEYIDQFHDNGIVLKRISKVEYDNFDAGDELSMDDIKNGNYKIE